MYAWWYVKIIGVCLCVNALSTPSLATSWLCIPKANAMVGHMGDKWVSNTGVEENPKYVVRPASGDDYFFNDTKPVWVVKTLGDIFAYPCKGDFDRDGFLQCDSVAGAFEFNRNTLRFQKVYGTGKIGSFIMNHEGESLILAVITIGICSKV